MRTPDALRLPTLALVMVLVSAVSGQSVPPMQAGWPVDAPGLGYWLQPTLADVNGDGALEVVVGAVSPDGLHVIQGDGTELPGWPVLNIGTTVGTPLVADVDGDGSADVARIRGYLLEVRDAGGVLKPGWPVQFPIGAFHDHIALADLNGDGLLEFVVGLTTGTLPTQSVHAYDAFGQPVPGWPVVVDLGPWLTGDIDDNSTLLCLVVGDLDADGCDEIVLSYGASVNQGFPTESPLFVLESDGSLASGWPRTVPGPNTWVRQIVLVDFDGDTQLEIITQGGGDLALWDFDGSRHPLTPSMVGGPGDLVAADLDGDGVPELVFGTGTLRVHERDGPFWNMTQISLGLGPSPNVASTFDLRVADVDDDGHSEIFVVAYSPARGLYMVDGATHMLVPGWPLLQEVNWPAIRTALGDIDGDGDVELVYAVSDTLGALDFPGGGASDVEWPMRGGGPRRTYQYNEMGQIPYRFLRGDSTGDGKLDLADAIVMLGEVVRAQTREYDCEASRDTNGDEVVDLGDALVLLQYLFQSGPVPSAPASGCGELTRSTVLGCRAFVCP